VPNYKLSILLPLSLWELSKMCHIKQDIVAFDTVKNTKKPHW